MCSCGRELSISLCNPMYKLTFFFFSWLMAVYASFATQRYRRYENWRSIENHTPTFLLFEKFISTAVSFIKIQRVCSILPTWTSVYVTVESFFSYKSIFMGSKTKNWYLGTGLLRPRAQVRYACWNRRQRQITVLFCVIKFSTLLQPQFIKEGKSDRCLHLLFLWLF